MKDNIEEIPKIINWCSERGVNFVDFQPVTPISMFSKMEALEKKKSMVPEESDLSRLSVKIEEGIKIACDLGVKTTLPLFKYYAGDYFRAVSRNESFFFFNRIVDPFSCLRIHTAPFLDYDCTMRLCPVLCSGADVKKRSLADGWRELEGLRRSIRQGRFPEDCRFCFCNIAENILFSMVKNPFKNIGIAGKLIVPLLRLLRK